VDNEVTPRAAEVDETERFPEETFRAMADMATDIQTGRVLAYWAATRCDVMERVRLEASYAKLFCSQVGMRVVNKAMQIFGGGMASSRSSPSRGCTGTSRA
jgi:alkylation response protein AidB-like acyl-CoA dehydrogenase